MYAAAVQATSEMQTQYTSTSLMATGNTHHIFDSVPPIQDDPFQQSSDALTQMIDNLGNAHHPVDRRGFMSTATIATTIRGFFKTSVVEGLGVPRSWPLPILIQTAAFRHQWRRLVALIHKCWLPTWGVLPQIGNFNNKLKHMDDHIGGKIPKLGQHFWSTLMYLKNKKMFTKIQAMLRK